MEKQQVELNYSRLEQMDITKGIGILSVIAGYGVVSGVSQNFIYSYHMPLFFLISGYFIKPFNKNSVKIAAGRLLKPYFFTAILIILIVNLTAVCALCNAYARSYKGGFLRHDYQISQSGDSLRYNEQASRK